MLCNDPEEHSFWVDSQKISCPRCTAIKVATRKAAIEDEQLNKLADIIVEKLLARMQNDTFRTSDTPR